MMTGAFSFHYGPHVVAGEGVSARLADWCPPGDVFLVTDRTIIALGLAEAAIAGLRAAGRIVTIFDAVEADPTRATLEAAVAAGRDAAVSAVVGLGGGSPMDVAKLAAYLLGSGDDLDAIWGVGQARGRGLPLLLVPTTAGTGSEATPIAIITTPDGEKRAVSAPPLIADHAVLDPLLTLGLPAAITAMTGIDAMVHAIEAFTSRHLKNPVSDALSREALRLLAGNLPVVGAAPGDRAARAAVLLGAHLAGVAFANAPVGGIHALAYPLGSRFHVPHGLANALMLPHVLRFNREVALPLYAELGAVVDPALAGGDMTMRFAGLVEAVQQIAASAGLPRTLREVGVSPADVPGLMEDAMRQTRLLANNPRPLGPADATALYEAAL
jgi:alcohol dehydrogenase